MSCALAPVAAPVMDSCIMQELLPPCAISVECWHDDATAQLFPEERAQLGKAIESRVQEFATSRSLARQALGILGQPHCPIPRGLSGEPLWPHGIVGSITHCTGYRAAAVAGPSRLASMGIDAEVHAPLPPGVVEIVLVPEELAWLSTASNRIHWDQVLFSAKESIYKAWFPLTRRWLDFDQVVITLAPSRGAFRVRPREAMHCKHEQILNQLSGRFLIHNGIVMTSAVLPLQS